MTGALAPLLFGASVVLGMTVKPEFLVVLILYFLLTIIYSVLKRFALVDCITLAILLHYALFLVE